MWRLLVFIVTVGCGGVAPLPAADVAGAMSVVDLRCDWAVDPLGVDAAPPRLSWKLTGDGRGLKQTAWQVCVASSREALAAERGDVWDSGRVPGDAQLHVPYAGRRLRSDVIFDMNTSRSARVTVTIPPNATAEVHVPADAGSNVTEGGVNAAERPGVTFLRRDGDRAVHAVGSGEYAFEAPWGARSGVNHEIHEK